MITEQDRLRITSAFKAIEAPTILTDALFGELNQANRIEDAIKSLRWRVTKAVLEKISNKSIWTSIIAEAIAEEFPNYFQDGPSLERFARDSMERDNGPRGEIKLFSVELDGETGTLVLTNQRGPVEIGFLPERIFGEVQGKYLITDSGLRKPTVQDHLWQNLDKDQSSLDKLLENKRPVFQKFLNSITEIIERANRQAPQIKEAIEKYIEGAKYFEGEVSELEKILTDLSSGSKNQRAS